MYRVIGIIGRPCAAKTFLAGLYTPQHISTKNLTQFLQNKLSMDQRKKNL